mgnify:CR=1 FL=1
MTPAVQLLQQLKIRFELLEYEHDATASSYGDEAAAKLGLDANIVFKTLVVQLESGLLAVAIVPVNTTLSVKSVAEALGVKKAVMADPSKVQRSSGYVLGGVSPLGQKRLLPTLLDSSAKQFDVINVSAGRRGLEIQLAPTDLLALTKGRYADIAVR